MTLHVHRAERASELADQLARTLDIAPPDPFTPDVIAVPTEGVERWLAQRLSHVLGATGSDGVCANINFPSPDALLAKALVVGSGIDPIDDPWVPGRTTLALLQIIDASLDEPWCETLASHLDATGTKPPGRRMITAQRLARLFNTYGANRPQMIRDWQRHNDTDGNGQPIPDDLAWQPQLWRQLREAINEPSPAERLPEACRLLRDQPGLTDLPERVNLFGPTRLTTAQLELLSTLAQNREVHLWLPHPSPQLWHRLASHESPSHRRRDETSSGVANNFLLASLGRDVRELQLHLRRHAPGHTDEHIALDATNGTPPTLLGRLQRAIRDDTEPTRPVEAPMDHSLQIHACHGPARQIEVLREVLVGLLEDDPTLEPRDILVMCPNIEDYASLISATFGLADNNNADTHPGHKLRVKVADRSLRQTNPLLGLIATVLELASSRVTAAQLLDLIALLPIRRRFHFSNDDLELMQSWARDTNVRWGIDADHRAPFGLGNVPNNTWRHGLDRILLGATMAEDDLRWVDRALPLDDVDSNDIDLAGRLAELADRLTRILDRLSGDHPLEYWIDALTDALDLFGDTSDGEAWQRSEATRELVKIKNQTVGEPMLGLGDVRALLANHLAGRPTRANFRTGNLTMCSMMPMRSVPHRIICLLGLDDGAFPRMGGIDGDDLLTRDPYLGERDPCSEDRQLLLDAIMAAREHLIILYTGNDPRTNAERPPAVPVGEILDAVDALATCNSKPPREHIVTRHPLQPFDPKNFIPGVLGTTARPFSFDRPSLAGARRAAQPRDRDNAFLDEPLPYTQAGADVALDELAAFLEQPTRAFLRQRLAITVGPDEGDTRLHDELSVELDGLQRWKIGERILLELIRGTGIDACVHAEARRGTLPPGELGKRLIESIKDEVRPLIAACQPYLGASPDSVDVIVDLVDGRRVVGTVSGIRNNAILRATYSTLAAKHRLRAWVQLLAVTAAHPEGEWRAITVGKSKHGRPVACLQPVTPQYAAKVLAQLVRLRDEGLRYPLPMSAETSASYAEYRRRFDVTQCRDKARIEWNGNNFSPGERKDAAHVLVYGDDAPFEALLAELHDGPEQTRFGHLSRLVWDPLLNHEQREDR